MSTPIQQRELSPEDPKFYAPPRWRSGDVAAPPIQPSAEVSNPQHHTDREFQPSLRASAQVPNPQAHADWKLPRDRVSLDDVPVTDSSLKPVDRPSSPDQNGVRTKALAIAAGVVIWTAFCVLVGLGRLDAVSFLHLQNGPAPAADAEVSVSERPQAAALPQVANSAPPSPTRQMSAPMLAVGDATGEMNAALPLAINVSNYTPGTTINLSGLVAGTTLSSGAAAGEGQWRIAIDDLPNTQVLPPADFVGPMTIVAELRSGDDQAIVRTPLQLVWRPVAKKSSEAAEPAPSPVATGAVDNTPKEVPVGQVLAWQKEAATTQAAPRVKARKLTARSTSRKRQYSASALDMETDTVTRWKSAPPSNYAISAYSDPRADRRSFWNGDLRTLIDRSWERCKYDCGRESRR